MSQREGEARVQSQREKVSVSTRANIPIPFPFGARLDANKAFLWVSTRVSASRVQFLSVSRLFFVLTREDVAPTLVPEKFVKHHEDVLCSYRCH